uniref:Uncharacterized protein n=1 Tax=Cyprinus carpio TaxID=7962 RepID=A0A8C2AY81_CYPCA
SLDTCELLMDSDWISSGASPGLLHIKLVTLVLMLCFSLLCGFSPVCVLRRATRFSSDPGSRQRVLSLASCLACGVFLASCLLELLPDFLNHMRDTFICSASLHLLFRNTEK